MRLQHDFRRVGRSLRENCRMPPQSLKGDALAKPNFQFQKRQKELEKKKKQEEKRLRKQERHAVPAADPQNPQETPAAGEVPPE
ncbi:MAG: hypothetical protein ABI981_12730 [Betaproteobacteria bacterium]